MYYLFYKKKKQTMRFSLNRENWEVSERLDFVQNPNLALSGVLNDTLTSIHFTL